MFNRERPDGHHLSLWIEDELIDAPGSAWVARGLWLAWSDHAAKIGVKAGTPRSFSNELSKAGFPWKRAPEVFPGRVLPSSRTRFHLGVQLRGPPCVSDDEGWAIWCGWHDRYGQ